MRITDNPINGMVFWTAGSYKYGSLNKGAILIGILLEPARTKEQPQLALLIRGMNQELDRLSDSDLRE
jgi:hypothetical protein